jgi:protein KRI1
MSSSSKSTKSSKSGTPSSKDHKSRSSSDDKASSKSKSKSQTPSKQKEASLSESSGSDDEFAVHVVREPKNVTILQTAAEIERKRHEGVFDDPNDLSLDSSSSDVSEDDDAVMAEVIADDFLDVLSKLASKHPDIYDKEKHFFPEEIEVEKEETNNEKRLTYKEMERQAILDRVAKGDDAGSDLDDEEELAKLEERTKALSYAEEQALAKKEMLAAAWGSGSDSEDDDAPGESVDDAGLIKKVPTKDQSAAIDSEYQSFLKKHDKSGQDPSKTKPAASKQRSGSVLPFLSSNDESDRYLSDFVLNKRWMGAPTPGQPRDGLSMDVDDESDTKELERQDDFETAYNFRYEDPNGATLVTHARSQESARVEKNKRAEKRARKRERQRLAKQAAEEEKIEEKKKRKAEILQRVQELASASGITEGIKKLVKDDDEWDPEAHDAAMESAFGDDYYAQEEKDKPTIPAEADIEDVEAWLAKVKKSGEKKQEKASSSKKGEEPEQDVEAIEKALEDYYNLDFEDDVAGERTRFRYMQVAPQNYGLSNEELLNMSDSELDQLIPMKKLATYREDGGSIKRQKLKYKKMLIRQQRGDIKRQEKSIPSRSSASKDASKDSKDSKSHSKKRRRDSMESSDVIEAKPSSKKSKAKEASPAP